MDRVSLKGIDVYAHHGVHPAERELGQRFVIDADLWADCSEAAASDSLGQALDYTAIHRAVSEGTAGSSFQLLEALAGLVPAWRAYRNSLADGLSIRL